MGGRAVEGTGLENRQTRKGLVGSNPTPSTIRDSFGRIASVRAVVAAGILAARRLAGFIRRRKIAGKRSHQSDYY